MAKENEVKKVDLRVLKTRKTLCETMISMLETGSIREITVQRLCEEAMVNRMTFYKHYEDKYDLLGDCMGVFKKNVSKTINATLPENADAVTYCRKIVEAVVDFCEKKKDTIKRLTTQENVVARRIILNSLQQYAEEILGKIAEKSGKKETYCPMSYAAAFITGGCARAVVLWLNNSGEYSKEQLIKDASDFFEAAINGNVLLK